MCPVTSIIQTINSSECLLSVWALGFALADWIYGCKGVTNVKPRELSVGEKLREDGKSIRAIAHWPQPVPTFGMSWRRKKPLLYSVANVELVDERKTRKNPKTTVSDISNNLRRAGVKVFQATILRRLSQEQKYRGHTRRCKPIINNENGKARLELAIWDEAHKFWDKVLWTDATKINLYQSDGKANVWRKKGSAHDPEHTSWWWF